MTTELDRSTRGPSARTVDVTSYEDTREAWTCPHLSAGLSGPGEEHFHLGTVMRLDGPAHVARRRAMGALLSRRGHEQFRERWLFPAADAGLADVLARRDADGFARVNIRKWALRVNQQLAAALTGLDKGTTPDGAQQLFELMEVVMRGRPQAFDVTLGTYDQNTPEARAALEARDTIVQDYYAPALERRKAMLASAAANSADQDGLPQDLLSLIAKGVDPAWLDPLMGQREAIFLLAAAVHTTSASLIWVLREVFSWLEVNPTQRHRLNEANFILRATQEALRLHPVVPGFPRLATEDVTLKSGKHIPEAAIALLRSGPADTDQSVFGADAFEFNPDREVRAGVNRFALAFGMGTHMCFGMPIVMGTGGIDGSLIYVLKKLFEAGVLPDESERAFDLPGTRGRFATNELGESYMVKFPPHEGG
jgi:cytochrome P450